MILQLHIFCDKRTLKLCEQSEVYLAQLQCLPYLYFSFPCKQIGKYSLFVKKGKVTVGPLLHSDQAIAFVGTGHRSLKRNLWKLTSWKCSIALSA